eukprot:CAMPEP_0197546362 /NCGR_PEP_ID=MMETSP1320-20131121/988_1 /TAXON_ID=91990 /ORGANISM="Bolidomonas sp., Strain RCC2347" /LENGTH=212 /DNA_ID=CAMNT_0043105913 /DNA_START=357 /DNA_END=992 /DNA_ORIENTATION=-
MSVPVPRVFVLEVLDGVLDYLKAVRRAREDALRVELHCRVRKSLVLHAHDDAVVGQGRDLEAGRELVLEPVEAVVPRDLKAGGEVGEHRLGPNLRNTAGFPVHGVAEDSEDASEVLHHALQPQADAERGDLKLPKRIHAVVELEVRGVSGPRGQHDEVWLATGLCLCLEELDGLGTAPQSLDVGTSLAEVVAQSVHEAVLVVNDDDGLPKSN